MNPALKRLSEIEQPATKGPWEVITSRDVFPAVIAPQVATIATDFESLSDAMFVSHARNALPALIAALVEIERWANHSGTYGVVGTVVNEIINRHLEPLK